MKIYIMTIDKIVEYVTTDKNNAFDWFYDAWLHNEKPTLEVWASEQYLARVESRQFNYIDADDEDEFMSELERLIG